ncbi:NADH dehydrogenase (ubiquinone) B14.5 B subunit [Leptinotarsa decemlineata]|uniref:NADH dehydrogenase (ubiquinone) B14.5 B subunit n=1 Tax=Leptinotarsa decemlineata TaxID=7539 RepID=UPI003D306FB9
MATGPTLPKYPLEALENDGCREPPLLSKYFPIACWGTVGFVSVIIANYASKRPVMSGIQRHIGVSIAAAYVGQVVDNYRTKYLADRDAVYRHYIQLHPEEFPPYERKQYKDVFERWVPIRS